MIEPPIDIIDECEHCPKPVCPERWIYAGELARRSGVSYYKIRKWTEQGLIRSNQRKGESAMYLERRSLEDVKAILESGIARRRKNTADRRIKP